jgi:hypothetical protein
VSETFLVADRMHHPCRDRGGAARGRQPVAAPSFRRQLGGPQVNSRSDIWASWQQPARSAKLMRRLASPNRPPVSRMAAASRPRLADLRNARAFGVSAPALATLVMGNNGGMKREGNSLDHAPPCP